MSTPADASPAMPLLYSGRISREALTVSIGVLLGVCWITTAIRFYVRIGIQRAFSVDDGFLLFGLASLTSGVGLLFSFLDKVYRVESFLLGQEALAFEPGFIGVSFDYQKLITVVLISSWVAISCVKLSFMFLFRRLIDRLQYVIVYWWAVLIFVLAISGYGIAVYMLACPYFYSLESLKCSYGPGLQRAINYAVSNMVLDVVGDILILVIPIHIIWKIKVERKQKFWLALSLCLTIVMIAVTITRASGIKTPTGQLDSLWEDYWNVISAEVGVIMTSATSFRALYISKTAAAARKQEAQSRGPRTTWTLIIVRSTKRLLTRVTVVRSWITRNRSVANKDYDLNEGSGSLIDRDQLQSLPHHVDLKTLPRAHMTGVRTFVEKAGRDSRSVTTQHLMQSHSEEEEMFHAPASESQTSSALDQQQQHQYGYGYAIHYPQRYDAQRGKRQEYV